MDSQELLEAVRKILAQHDRGIITVREFADKTVELGLRFANSTEPEVYEVETNKGWIVRCSYITSEDGKFFQKCPLTNQEVIITTVMDSLGENSFCPAHLDNYYGRS